MVREASPLKVGLSRQWRFYEAMVGSSIALTESIKFIFIVQVDSSFSVRTLVISAGCMNQLSHHLSGGVRAQHKPFSYCDGIT